MPSEEQPSFFKRHDRFLSLLGAGIVLLTFVIKDNLRAQWNSAADAIDRAESTFDLRSDLDAIRKQNRWIETRTYLMQNYGCKPFSPEGENMTVTYTIKPDGTGPPRITKVNPEAIEGSFLESHSRLQTAKVLLDHLPAEKKLAERLEQVNKELEKQEALLNDEKKAAADDKSKMPTPFLLHVSDEISEKMDPYTPIVDANDLASDTLKRAKEVRDENTKRAHAAAIWTNLLFVFGWGLGLVGKGSTKG